MNIQPKNFKIKSIITITIAIILLLLLIFSEDIIKMQNKNKIGLSESSSFETIPNEPNIPRISAGMIPIKWNGNYWIITTQDDKEWYDYSTGKLAYMMLNDGTYQSELLRDMEDKKLAEDNIGVPIGESQLGTIFAWLPRYAYKESGEIKYAPSEMQPGGEWLVPQIFVYSVTDETKPDFSLGGVWIQKNDDIEYANKLTEMKKEEGRYGFLANTKAMKIISEEATTIQKYIVDEGIPEDQFADLTSTSRIILKIVDTTKYEPIKANVQYNAIDSKIEIRVTYSKNGINKILDEYGNEMTYTEKDGMILADTGDKGLAKGTYYFTIIDNEENKKELNIDVIVDSLFKIAYINGIDNMNIDKTYAKTQETKTTAENTLLNQITAIDTSTTYSRAIKDGNNAITAIGEETRGSEDEQIYLYGKYKVNEKNTYSLSKSTTNTTRMFRWSGENQNYGWKSYSFDSSSGKVTFSNWSSPTTASTSITLYSVSGLSTRKSSTTNSTISSFYQYDNQGTEHIVNTVYCKYNVYTWNINKKTTYSRGNFIEYISGTIDQYPNNDRSGSYWYVRNNLMKKYKLYKYDENLNLKSTYNVDTKEITTIPIDISYKGNNKVKLTLTTSGSTYKTYISNDNSTWQEITDITSGIPKELNVDGWDKLYIKIETNTSRIDNIDVTYYKD